MIPNTFLEFFKIFVMNLDTEELSYFQELHPVYKYISTGVDFSEHSSAFK